MTVSVFVGSSVDGFIARPNGDLDFLPAGGGEPHGYDEFMASVDALVIGNTFETVLKFPAWPYGDKRVVVLSNRPIDLSKVRGAVLEQMAGPPAEIVSRLAATGAHNLYVDGGITIQRFLRAGLVQRRSPLDDTSAFSASVGGAAFDRSDENTFDLRRTRRQLALEETTLQ
jgi:dihydrofolate reductase